MVEYWEVNVISQNKKGKRFEEQFSYQDFIGAVRVITGYKTKRGYEVLMYSLEKVEKLV